MITATGKGNMSSPMLVWLLYHRSQSFDVDALLYGSPRRCWRSCTVGAYGVTVGYHVPVQASAGKLRQGMRLAPSNDEAVSQTPHSFLATLVEHQACSIVMSMRCS